MLSVVVFLVLWTSAVFNIIKAEINKLDVNIMDHNNYDKSKKPIFVLQTYEVST